MGELTPETLWSRMIFRPTSPATSLLFWATAFAASMVTVANKTISNLVRAIFPSVQITFERLPRLARSMQQSATGGITFLVHFSTCLRLVNDRAKYNAIRLPEVLGHREC